MVALRRQAAVMRSVRLDEAPRQCTVLRCSHEAESASPGAPAPFCVNHWLYLKNWQRRSITEAFTEKRWDDYFEVVRLCSDALGEEIERAREMGFQGIVLARHFSAEHPRGVIVRMAGKRVA